MWGVGGYLVALDSIHPLVLLVRRGGAQIPDAVVQAHVQPAFVDFVRLRRRNQISPVSAVWRAVRLRTRRPKPRVRIRTAPGHNGRFAILSFIPAPKLGKDQGLVFLRKSSRPARGNGHSRVLKKITKSFRDLWRD